MKNLFAGCPWNAMRITAPIPHLTQDQPTGEGGCCCMKMLQHEVHLNVKHTVGTTDLITAKMFLANKLEIQIHCDIPSIS
jgi:hypothetical protein